MLAITAGKMVSTLCKISGRGSSLPGYIARKLSKNFLKKLTYPEIIIMVSGTNGKTTATHYIANILKSQGINVLTNDTGANMIQGISTSILKKSATNGKVNAEALVLEVDEAHLKLLCEEIKPSHLVLTNLFADQADRFGSPKKLAELIANTIPSKTKVYLNGDDPILCYLGSIIKNKKHYYGLDIDKEGLCVDEICPSCDAKLNYTKKIYDHLGRFICNCGFSSPNFDTIAKVDEIGTFSINGEKYRTTNEAIYFSYNALSSLAITLDMGISHKTARPVIEKSLVGNGRLEEFSFNSKKTLLNLVKNPAGANLSLEIIAKEKEEYSLFFAANNEPADGTDPSWIETIAFEELSNTKLNTVYLAGQIQDELEIAINKKLDGIKIVKGEANILIEKMKKNDMKCYFLANFTMLAPVRKILEL